MLLLHNGTNSTNGTAPSPLGGGGGDTLSILANTLAVIFFVIGLGYFSSLSGFVPRTANKGIGPLVGKVCLPLLIFRNVAKLDLSSVEFGIVGCCFLVKVISFLCAVVVAWATRTTGADAKPGDLPSQFGIYTIFCTGSNDLAMGLAIIQSLYPASTTPGIDLGALTFVVVAMQVSIFNPIHFALLELGKSLRDIHDKRHKDGEGEADADAKPVRRCDIAKTVALNLLRSPILIATFLGLIYNGINPPIPGDTSPNRNIPALLDAMMAKGGSAFGMAALFLGGMAIVGKFGLLRGKKLVLPLLLSMIKVLVAPIVGFYITRAVYAGNPSVKLFSEYVFIYASLPTAGSVIVFAQSFNVPAKDMISGAAVLVLLIFVPIMFTTATLLVGGDLGEIGIADGAHTMSIIGCGVLIVSVAISPDWRTFPKVGLAQIGLAGLLFSSFHVKCNDSVRMLGNGWGESHDMSAARATLFARLWHRLLVSFGLGLNVLLIHVKGKVVARRWFPYISGVLLLAAISMMAGFAASPGGDVKSRYPCWYNYGPSQIEFDFVFMILELIFVVGVLATVSNVAPAKADVNEAFTNVFAKKDKTKKDSIASSDDIGLSVLSSSDASNNPERSISSESIVLETCGEGSELDRLLDQDAKCGITGGYMYRTKLFLSIGAVSLMLQLLANRTALKFAQGGLIGEDDASTQTDPILAFIQILTIVLVDGHGLIFCLAFMSMRTSGWFRWIMSCKRAYRKCVYQANASAQGAFDPNTGNVSEIPLMLRRLANRIATMPKLLRNRRFRLKVYTKCVPGNALLDRLLKDKLVGSRAEGLELVQELHNVGLIYHVTYEHEFKDASFFYRVVFTEGAGITEAERRAVATGQGGGAQGSAGGFFATPPPALPLAPGKTPK
jgi:predicted permease